MRVSDAQIYRAITINLQNSTARTMELQNRLSTGSRLNRPSDSPIDYTKRMEYNTTLSKTKQYLRNIENGQVNMSIAENILGEGVTLLMIAKEKAIAQATASATTETRQIEAIEIENIANQLAFIGNTQIGDKFIFSGFKTDTQPFNTASRGTYTGTAIDPVTTPVVINAGVNDTLTVDINGLSGTITLTPGTYNNGATLAAEIDTQLAASPSFSSTGSAKFQSSKIILETDNAGNNNTINVTGGTARVVLGLIGGTAATGAAAGATYSGDNGQVNINIDTNIRFTSNNTGDIIFKGTGGGIDIFTSLENLRSALSSNDPNAIQVEIDRLDTAIQQIINARTTMGTKMNMLDRRESSLMERTFQTEVLKSDINDSDMIKDISELVMQQQILEISKSVAQKIFSSSLINFIR